MTDPKALAVKLKAEYKRDKDLYNDSGYCLIGNSLVEEVIAALESSCPPKGEDYANLLQYLHDNNAPAEVMDSLTAILGRMGQLLEASDDKAEVLKAIEAAIIERKSELRRIKAEGIAERRGAQEMMAQTGIATCDWFLKLITEAESK